MNVVIIGKKGQLAWELQKTAPRGMHITALASADLDITDGEAVHETLQTLRPAIVVNAAAYTAVDKAESEAEQAFQVNETGVKNIASACKALSARVVHVSTDFVFDGSQTTPYQPQDATNPINVYGASKLAGEQGLLQLLPDSVIVRTSWVYSAHGNNFVKTMLRLMAEKPKLGVVYDQVGTPTWANGLARWIWAVAQKPEVSGIHHWTDAGVTSWYDFAVAIQELGLAKGLLEREIPIAAIPASQYPTPAKRPSFSVMDKSTAEHVSGIATVHWRKQLTKMMDQLR